MLKPINKSYHINVIQLAVLLFHLRNNLDNNNDPDRTLEELTQELQKFGTGLAQSLLEKSLAICNIDTKNWMLQTPQYQRLQTKVDKFIKEVAPTIHAITEFKNKAKKQNPINLPEFKYKIQTETHRIGKNILESLLYNANLMDEEKLFWHPYGKSFEQFVNEILGKGEAFNRYYNYIYEQEPNVRDK